MAELRYRDLAEVGLPLITRGDPSFSALANEIESLPGPGPVAPDVVTDGAAVLLNQSGRAIVALEFAWHYTTRNGFTRTSRFSNLTSSAQREVLTGRHKVGRDLGTFILPGSKRLITEHGIFGNNMDVLTPEESGSMGYCGGWGGDGRRGNEAGASTIELILDLVILEDGLCVGPDESGMYEALRESLALQHTTAQEALAALQDGASVGRVFEIVRPLARDEAYEQRAGGKRRRALPLANIFGNEAVHHLLNSGAVELLRFFEEAAESPSLELRRSA